MYSKALDMIPPWQPYVLYTDEQSISSYSESLYIFWFEFEFYALICKWDSIKAVVAKAQQEPHFPWS